MNINKQSYPKKTNTLVYSNDVNVPRHDPLENMYELFFLFNKYYEVWTNIKYDYKASQLKLKLLMIIHGTWLLEYRNINVVMINIKALYIERVQKLIIKAFNNTI